MLIVLEVVKKAGTFEKEASAVYIKSENSPVGKYRGVF
jgi:hypothetical protein